MNSTPTFACMERPSVLDVAPIRSRAVAARGVLLDLLRRRLRRVVVDRGTLVVVVVGRGRVGVQGCGLRRARARAIRVGGVKAAADATTPRRQTVEPFRPTLVRPAPPRRAQRARGVRRGGPRVRRRARAVPRAIVPVAVPANWSTPRRSVRGVASAALAAVGDAHSADALLPALLTSLESAKAPRAKTGVLEFALYVLSGQGGGTDPTGIGKSPASAGSGALSEVRSIHWSPYDPRSRGERRSLRTLPGASLRPSLAFNPRPRRLSTPL